jgi:hypothetical protein
MPEDWVAIAAEAQAAIDENGFTASLVRADTGPATPWDGTAVVPGDPIAVKVLRDTWTRRRIDGTLIRSDDQWFLVGAAVEVRADDHLLVQGIELQIVEAKPLAPGGPTLLYEVQARR